MPEKYEGNITAYPVESIKAQTQGPDKDEKTKEQTPGHDSNMDPPAVWTQLEEFKDDGTPYLRDYTPGNRLKGKAALITGGDSGIGRSVAMLYALEGCDLTIVHLPEEASDAEDVRAWIERKGRRCELIAVDLRKEENCKKIVDEHMARYGRLDVLVNNAARQSMCMNFEDIDLADVESTFRLNILAIFAITKFALPHMKRGSSIINSTSVAAYSKYHLLDYE